MKINKQEISKILKNTKPISAIENNHPQHLNLSRARIEDGEGKEKLKFMNRPSLQNFIAMGIARKINNNK